MMTFHGNKKKIKICVYSCYALTVYCTYGWSESCSYSCAGNYLCETTNACSIYGTCDVNFKREPIPSLIASENMLYLNCSYPDQCREQTIDCNAYMSDYEGLANTCFIACLGDQSCRLSTIIGPKNDTWNFGMNCTDLNGCRDSKIYTMNSSVVNIYASGQYALYGATSIIYAQNSSEVNLWFIGDQVFRLGVLYASFNGITNMVCDGYYVCQSAVMYARSGIGMFESLFFDFFSFFFSFFGGCLCVF